VAPNYCLIHKFSPTRTSFCLLLNNEVLLIQELYSLVSEGKDVFGDGNIELAVSMFEKKHVCNDYCTWSGFKLQRYGAVETETESN
jgi:hypothetical protein